MLMLMYFLFMLILILSLYLLCIDSARNSDCHFCSALSLSFVLSYFLPNSPYFNPNKWWQRCMLSFHRPHRRSGTQFISVTVFSLIFTSTEIQARRQDQERWMQLLQMQQDHEKKHAQDSPTQEERAREERSGET